MLLCEDGGGDENGGLFSSSDGFECCSYCNFGFAKSYVSADETIHGLGAFHVFFGVFDGGELVWGLGVAEGVFKFPHPLGVGWVAGAFSDLSLCLEAEELGSVVHDGFLCGFSGAAPFGIA